MSVKSDRAMSATVARRGPRVGFTLIELLVVIAIISILATIGLVNFNEAQRRARRVECAANLKTIGQGLMSYRIDYDTYPLADGMAGEGESQDRTKYGGGPAGNGYWSAIPNSLVRLHYLANREMLFCPSLWIRYRDDRERMRYAYNAGALDVGGFTGGGSRRRGGQIDGLGAGGGHVWVLSCLHVNTKGFAPERYVAYPHGPDPIPEENVWGDENILWSDFAVSLEPGASP